MSNTTGLQNTAIGDRALQNNTQGGGNTATGFQTLGSNIDGNLNTAYGDRALFSHTSGDGNTAVGFQALINASGSENIALGHSAGGSISTADHVIAIGHGGADVSNTTWIGNVFGVTTVSSTTAPVIVSDNGQLGTVVSSERFKKDIESMDKASQAIHSLRPVTFHYKNDDKCTAQFGLIAEEVAKVNSALVLLDKEGKPFTVRYDQVNAMLLNEFLKEHRKVEEQSGEILEQRAMIAEMRQAIGTLTATVKEQDVRIQQVRSQFQVSGYAELAGNP